MMPSKITRIWRAAIIAVIVIAFLAYMILRVNDTNWSSWVRTAMGSAIDEITYVEGDSRQNVTSNFIISKSAEYRDEKYSVLWTETSDCIAFKDNGDTITVEVSRDASEDKTATIKGLIIREGLEVHGSYDFKIKKAA